MRKDDLAFDTESRKAFEEFTAALKFLEEYKTSKNRDQLESAELKLSAAITEDSDYLAPKYFLAILEDLKGRPKDAVEKLSELYPQLSEVNRRVRNEARYNLAVAHYHRYSHEHLESAAQEVESLLREVKVPILLAAAHALLAQIHAMWEIPKVPEPVDDAERSRMCRHFEEAQKEVGEALKHANPRVRLWNLFRIQRPERREIVATAHNAMGMAIMYHTDYFEPTETKVKLLKKALKNLEKSESLHPDDWANWCDLGSCQMRIAVHSQERRRFKEGRRYLKRVIEDLRSNYGFALYEVGRSYRYEGRFEEAIKWFDRALEVPVEYRDVGDRRVSIEKGRAEASDTIFP